MAQRETVKLLRRDLLPPRKNTEQQEFWLYSHSEYDPNGNLTEQSVYNQNGSLVERVIREYNDSGFLIREQYFVDDGEPSDEKSYERDDNGLILKEFKHYLDGSYDTTVYFYDSQHRIARTITTSDEGEVEQEMLNEYREDRLVKNSVSDGEGNLLQTSVYGYDEAGNSAEFRQTDHETGESIHLVTHYNSAGHKETEISYDEEGDIISQVFYKEDDEGRMISMAEQGDTKNTITDFAYDDLGNVIQQTEQDKDGNLLMSVKRTYDEGNNMLTSEVFIEGRGRSLPQHYEIRLEYSFYES